MARAMGAEHQFSIFMVGYRRIYRLDCEGKFFFVSRHTLSYRYFGMAVRKQEMTTRSTVTSWVKTKAPAAYLFNRLEVVPGIFPDQGFSR